MPISAKENSMKIAVLIARVLLGLLFLVFGLNGFLNFLHMPMPSGLAGQYMGALFVSHYLVVVFLVQVVGGALLLSGQFIPLALILLGPVIVNIFLFHAFLAQRVYRSRSSLQFCGSSPSSEFARRSPASLPRR
jgi:uncharacterized membrane protein YphA (DoxX/SURF4 family)